MAQEIMVAGAIYEGVPSVRLPDSNGVFHPFTDTSDTTAVAADVAQGKTFHLADGSAATGTAAGATLVTKSITANGTYDASDDGADGYSEVTVNVSGGGGGGGVDPKDVNFIDYDGQIVYAYTAAEFAELTALPENPTHDGLVAQGWNWTLLDAQDKVADIGELVIGQMYVTDDGKTRVYVNMVQGRLSPWLSLALNGTAVVDWGDGTTPDTITGTSKNSATNVHHEYAAAGRYVIAIDITSGSANIRSFDTSATQLLKPQNGSNSYNTTKAYAASIVKVEMGNNIGLNKYAFGSCYAMESVTIPYGVSITADYAFTNCTSLRCVVLPSLTGSSYTIGGYTFNLCTSLEMVSLPKQYTYGNQNEFYSCYALEWAAFPSVFMTVNSYYFYDCRALRALTFPSTTTTIASNALYSLATLSCLTIPSSVTAIQSNAISYLSGLGELHFKGATPATASSNALISLPTDCTIYVPAGTLSAYTSAANYPDPATYTYVEE